ncbi:MAG TPA: DUF3098 domain-containing protein [Saprospiraceae bacterium]|nr:DUF3098 domain-containing protein [Saprospiraceae bacterium]
MSKDLKPKKKPTISKPGPTPVARRSNVRSQQQSFPLLLDKKNYLLIAISCGVIGFGLILMLGGGMKDPNVWDESVIYSFRRITLAPIVILAGLVLAGYAIFKK